jgi:hypothetical protein
VTHDAALAHVRDTLKGQEITAEIIGRDVPAFAVVSREALATLVDGDWTVRPLGVLESEAKRERAGTSGTSGVASLEENGAVSAPAPTPTPCAECGVPLETHEVERIADAKGTKFEQLCNDCCYIALGLR